ncbi:hypothetical protein D3C76_1402630 [compost metagenome]
MLYSLSLRRAALAARLASNGSLMTLSPTQRLEISLGMGALSGAGVGMVTGSCRSTPSARKVRVRMASVTGRGLSSATRSRLPGTAM